MAYRPDRSDLPLEEDIEPAGHRRAVRLLLVGVAIVVAVVFMAQNNDEVELNFLFISVESRLWVGMLVTLLLGALLGQGVEALWDRRQRRRRGD